LLALQQQAQAALLDRSMEAADDNHACNGQGRHQIVGRKQQAGGAAGRAEQPQPSLAQNIQATPRTDCHCFAAGAEAGGVAGVSGG